MKEKRVVPELRFPGYMGDWVEKEIGPYLCEYKERTPANTDYPVLTSSRNGLYHQEQYFSNRRVVNDNEYGVIPWGYFTYRHMSDDLIFKFNINYLVPKGAISKEYPVFTTTNMLHPFFLQLCLNYGNPFKKFAIEQKQGGTRTRLYFKKLKKLRLPIPSLPEQKKIAAFLSDIDQKIELLSRKKELLDQYKKGMMQKLFTQELRFKDDDGGEFPNWEERTLDSLVSKFVVPMRDKPKDLSGEVPWCRIEDFEGKYLSKSKSGKGVSHRTILEMNLKIYPINTLLVSCSANLGYCAIVKKELITNQTFIGLVPETSMLNIDYFLYIMRLSAKKLNTLSSGTTIAYLSRKQFENFKIPYPNILEQQKIASFISDLDKKIEINSLQKKQMESFKKGLLQKMFV